MIKAELLLTLETRNNIQDLDFKTIINSKIRSYKIKIRKAVKIFHSTKGSKYIITKQTSKTRNKAICIRQFLIILMRIACKLLQIHTVNQLEILNTIYTLPKLRKKIFIAQ